MKGMLVTDSLGRDSGDLVAVIQMPGNKLYRVRQRARKKHGLAERIKKKELMRDHYLKAKVKNKFSLSRE